MTLFILVVLLIAGSIRVSFAQLPAYESFSAIPTGSPVAASGANAKGWTNNGWSGAADELLKIIDPNPNLNYQVLGGGFINGSTRALEISTRSKPITGKRLIYRTIPTQNTTFYLSFLVRPVFSGTSADQIDISLLSGSNLLGRIMFSPNPTQDALLMSIPRDSSSSYGSSFGSYSLPLGVTSFIVVQISRSTLGQISFRCWRNPSSTFSLNGIGSTEKSVSLPRDLNAIGFGVSSGDSGGDITTAIFDEFRVGFTWSEVVPLAPVVPPDLAPNLEILPAFNLRWPTVSSKYYQVQHSYDLQFWSNFGARIAGDGTIKSLYVPAHEEADPAGRKFYRIITEQ